MAKSSNRTGGVFHVIKTILIVIQIIASAGLIVLLFRSQFLPALFLGIAAIILAFLIFACMQLTKDSRYPGRCVFGVIISVLVSAMLLVSDFYLFQVTHTLQNISDAKEETTRVSVYVLNEDPAQSIQDAAGYKFGILEKLVRVDTDHAVGMINEELGKEIQTGEYSRSNELAQALLDHECGAIILTEGFVNLITEMEGYETFDEQIREIAVYEWTSEIRREHNQGQDEKEQKVNENVFTMFISGIDTTGPISTRSRSDVNIIAVVNTDSRQILLISTPRDYYVPLSISEGIPDKLTHAGIYGVNVSMDTLSMLYDIDMDYYFRVNFSGFEQVIDALGGVSVVSEQTFDVGSNHFVEGLNELNGEQALVFARERHSFADGDRQRGRNQMAVITGVISKMQSPAILQNFTDLLAGLEGSFETNMPYAEISALVRDQLTDNGAWSVSTYSVDGTGEMNTTYSANQKLYVMIPDQETVDTAKEMIQQIIGYSR